jgi:hypothetical protein
VERVDFEDEGRGRAQILTLCGDPIVIRIWPLCAMAVSQSLGCHFSFPRQIKKQTQPPAAFLPLNARPRIAPAPHE